MKAEGLGHVRARELGLMLIVKGNELRRCVFEIVSTSANLGAHYLILIQMEYQAWQSMCFKAAYSTYKKTYSHDAITSSHGLSTCVFWRKVKTFFQKNKWVTCFKDMATAFSGFLEFLIKRSYILYLLTEKSNSYKSVNLKYYIIMAFSLLIE